MEETVQHNDFQMLAQLDQVFNFRNPSENQTRKASCGPAPVSPKCNEIISTKYNEQTRRKTKQGDEKKNEQGYSCIGSSPFSSCSRSSPSSS